MSSECLCNWIATVGDAAKERCPIHDQPGADLTEASLAELYDLMKLAVEQGKKLTVRSDVNGRFHVHFSLRLPLAPDIKAFYGSSD